MASIVTDHATPSPAPAEMAAYIQHTKIEVGSTRAEMEQHAAEAAALGFDAAMVPASWVSLTADVLAGTGVGVATALDFPTVGVMTSAGKAAEAAEAARQGATQLDMGVQIGWLKSGMFTQFREDIAGVVRASGLPVKVMLELPLLTETEKEAAIELSMEAGAAYLKNASSGAIETASPDSVRYLAQRTRGGVLVKASGSIKSYRQGLELLRAGAALLGTSAGPSIIRGEEADDAPAY